MFSLPSSNTRTGGVASQEATDTMRRIANMLRYGKVHEADYGAARIRVLVGDASDPTGHLVTDWLPWMTSRAGKDVDWWAPEVGETVMVLSPGGELGGGAVMPATFSSDSPAPADRATVRTVKFEDGAEFTYDKEAHKLTVKIPGDVLIEAEGNITIKGARIDLNPDD